MVLVVLGLVVTVFLLLNRVPKTYPSVAIPIEPPSPNHSLGGGLDGFDSPYLGHTGSWDGKGGAMGGRPKASDLDREVEMGLRWTFMPVYWRALEPDGPVDLAKAIPPAWRALDAFIIAAHQRKLNVLIQAPVMGGKAAAAFAGKLAARYAPGGTLAGDEGWQQSYGVRAWEMDNEPNGYLTFWKDQAADYAEFVTKSAIAIRQVDRQAVIIGPAANIGSKSLAWIESTLDAPSMCGSPEFRRRGHPYSIGPAIDVVSFHVYEGLDTAFMGKDRTIEVVFTEVRDVFERWQNRAAGFTYARKDEYWHTEGNFDFLGVLSRQRRAAWRIQFLTRAFAAGVRKVMVMDASGPEQNAVRAYIRALPNPFPMQRADDQVRGLRGTPVVFCHRDNANADAGCVWILWSAAGTGDAEVELPTIRKRIKAVQVDGTDEMMPTTNEHLRVRLRGESKMAPPVLLIDRIAPLMP
jgi:hypothetical protein